MADDTDRKGGAAGRTGADAAQQGRDALQRSAEQMRGAGEASARLSRDLIERAGQNFDVMRRIGEAMGSGARAAGAELSEFVRHTGRRQQEMAQDLARARTPGEVLEIQTRHFQDGLRELLGLSERLARNSAETARQAGQEIGKGEDRGGS